MEQNKPKPLKDRTLDELYRTFRRTHGKDTAMWFAKQIYDAFHEHREEDADVT